MATQILATGSTAAESSEFTVTAGIPVTVALKGGSAHNGPVQIQLKDDANEWVNVGTLGGSGSSVATVINGPGVYRLLRPAGTMCGAFYA